MWSKIYQYKKQFLKFHTMVVLVLFFSVLWTQVLTSLTFLRIFYLELMPLLSLKIKRESRIMVSFFLSCVFILNSICNVCIRVAFQSRFHARHAASDIGYSYILCAKNNGNSCPLACKINGTSSSGFLARLTWSNLLWGESPSQEI